MGLEKIDILKKKLSLTSKELSEKSGVPLGTLNKILNGTTKDPKLETLKSLARVLGCTLDDFDDTTANEEKMLTNEEEILLADFNKLNDLGKKEANKRVRELTQISTYSNELLIAAHDDGLTDEEKEIMDSKIQKILEKRNHR